VLAINCAGEGVFRVTRREHHQSWTGLAFARHLGAAGAPSAMAVSLSHAKEASVASLQKVEVVWCPCRGCPLLWKSYAVLHATTLHAYPPISRDQHGRQPAAPLGPSVSSSTRRQRTALRVSDRSPPWPYAMDESLFLFSLFCGLLLYVLYFAPCALSLTHLMHLSQPSRRAHTQQHIRTHLVLSLDLPRPPTPTRLLPLPSRLGRGRGRWLALAPSQRARRVCIRPSTRERVRVRI
jgi:hypothetical protein